jgi:hypothetical protein
MCRAIKVMCVAPDDAALAALKRASVGVRSCRSGSRGSGS